MVYTPLYQLQYSKFTPDKVIQDNFVILVQINVCFAGVQVREKNSFSEDNHRLSQ